MSTAEQALSEARSTVEHASASLPLESPTLGKLAEALSKAQGQMVAATKSTINPHFKSRYADLASIWDAIRKPLADNGLAVFQRTSSRPGGVKIETTLAHISGEFVRDSCWLPVAQATPQAYGSALTYARRYSLAALVGVVADEDDDGNAAAGRQTHSAPSRTEQIKQAIRERAPAVKLGESLDEAETRHSAEMDDAEKEAILAAEREQSQQFEADPELDQRPAPQDFKLSFPNAVKGKMASQLTDKELVNQVKWRTKILPESRPEYMETNGKELALLTEHAQFRGLMP